MTHPASLESERLLADCEVRFARRSGPGGQHRNKVETAAILTHRPTGLIAEANERRSQVENRRMALFRLRVRLALEVRDEGAEPKGPSPLWRSRCRGGRLSVNPQHEDYPSLLAEALDTIARHEGEVRDSAEFLGCTPTQLIRFLKSTPQALTWLNNLRRERGQPPLR